MTTYVTIAAALAVDVGDDVVLTATFTDTAGDAADPSTVTFVVTDPDGNSDSYVLADAEVDNPAVGSFTCAVVTDQAGEWTWRVTGTGGGVEASDSGSFTAAPAATHPTAAYDRWGMDVAAAIALTGEVRMSSARLYEAEEDVVAELGWRPDPDDYGSADPTLDTHDVRVLAYGRAVAWQAAYRADTPAAAADGSTGIASETIDGYSVEYRDGRGPDDGGRVPARVKTELARAGWYAPVRSGRSHTLPR